MEREKLPVGWDTIENIFNVTENSIPLDLL